VKAKRLVSVAVTARDLSAALSAWRKVSGLTVSGIDAGQRATMPVRDISISLIAALPDESEGLRSLTIAVESLADAVAELRAKGVAVSDATVADDGVLSAMINPKSTYGVPIRLVEEQT